MTFLSDRLTAERSEREAWRVRLIEAAEGIAHGAQDIGNRFDVALLTEPLPEEAARLADLLEPDVSAFLARTTRVLILFGEDSPTGEFASTMAQAYADAHVALKHANLVEARRSVEATDKPHADFIRAVHAAIKPDVWTAKIRRH